MDGRYGDVKRERRCYTYTSVPRDAVEKIELRGHWILTIVLCVLRK